jgi:hypothetical protein
MGTISSMSDKLQKIIGKIEAIGQSKFTADSYEYAYIRILTEDGNVLNIEKITVYNKVNSYVGVGVQGAFYIGDFLFNKVVFAIETNGRRENDIDKVANNHILGKLMAIVVLPFGVFLMGIGIGFVITLLAIWVFYKACKCPTRTKIVAFMAHADGATVGASAHEEKAL